MKNTLTDSKLLLFAYLAILGVLSIAIVAFYALKYYYENFQYH